METKADRGELLTSFKVLDTYKLSDILTRYRREVTPKKRGALYEDYVIDALSASLKKVIFTTGSYAVCCLLKGGGDV